MALCDSGLNGKSLKLT